MMTHTRTPLSAVSLGTAISRLRNESGHTIETLSRSSSIPISRIWSIERGKAMPTIVELHTLAQALGSTSIDIVRMSIEECQVQAG